MKVSDSVNNVQIVGRFAPSPTGDLHMGSLMTALASCLNARSRGGRWLVRIEDLDPPREVPGAAGRILTDLERFGFEWDGPILFQHERHERYREVLDDLIADDRVYPCVCSRREIQSAGLVGVDGVRYGGRCREGLVQNSITRSWRLRVPDEFLTYQDGIQGLQRQNLAQDVGDFVLFRSDGFWAYQLAVVVDDSDQGVNQVLRGADLLDSTPRQVFLQQLLGWREPEYLHIPVITNSLGQKLSKQTRAPVLQAGNEAEQLVQALQLLWQPVPSWLYGASLQDVWRWALAFWSVDCLPQKRSISVSIDQRLQYKFLELEK